MGYRKRLSVIFGSFRTNNGLKKLDKDGNATEIWLGNLRMSCLKRRVLLLAECLASLGIRMKGLRRRLMDTLRTKLESGAQDRSRSAGPIHMSRRPATELSRYLTDPNEAIPESLSSKSVT